MTADARKKFKLGGVVFPTPLFSYQAAGIWKMTHADHLGLFDEQGMGKAIQALYATHYLKRVGEIDATLITCPSYLVDTWGEQIREHLPAATRVQVLAHQQRNKRAWRDDADYYILNYELLGRTSVTWTSMRGLDHDNAWRMLARRSMAIIGDETQYISNIDANVTQSLCRLATRAKRRYALTGTPVAEHPENVWSQFLFLDGGALLGKNYSAFVKRYCVTRQIAMRDAVITKIIGYKHLRELHKKIGAASIRRTKEQYQKDLPPKMARPLHPRPSPPHAKLLRGMSAKLLDSLESIMVHGNMRKFGELSGQIQAMHRAAAMPDLIDPSITNNVKLNLLEEYLSGYDGQCVVWTHHRDVGQLLYATLRKRRLAGGLVLVQGGMQKSVKSAALNAFKDGKTKTLIASTPALSEGENRLIGASYAFYFQLSSSLKQWRQSQDRFQRIGSKGQAGGAHKGMIVLDVPLLHGSLDPHTWTYILQKGGNADIVTEGRRAQRVEHNEAESLRRYLKEVV